MHLAGDRLAADLSELRMIGEIDLPELAYTYATLNNAVASTSVNDSAAFQQPGGGAGMTQLYASWSALRDYLQDNLGATANTLLAARQAIRHIVEAYANADATAKKRLLAEWRNGPPSWKPSEKAPPGPPPTVVDSYIRRAAENP